MYEQAILPGGRAWPVAGFGAVLPGAPDLQATEIIGGLKFLKYRDAAVPVIGTLTVKQPATTAGGEDAGTLNFLQVPSGGNWVNDDAAKGNVILVNATSVSDQLNIIYMSTTSVARIVEQAGPAGAMAILAGPQDKLRAASASAQAVLGIPSQIDQTAPITTTPSGQLAVPQTGVAGWWASLSTTEKIVVVGGVGIAAFGIVQILKK